jgi:hypothetical protein
MNHLLRSLAPISDSGWELLDDQGRSRLTAALAARKVVDFAGPSGWEHSAANLGRVKKVKAGRRRDGAVTGGLVPRRATGRLRDQALRAPRLRPRAAGRRPRRTRRGSHKIAVAENTAVFNGWKEVGITGIAKASPHKAQKLGAAAESYPRPVAAAVELLLETGSEDRTRSPSGEISTRASSRRRDTAVTRCSTISARSWTGRSSGRPASREPSSLASGAATSASSRARTSRSATTVTTPTPSKPISNRASASW